MMQMYIKDLCKVLLQMGSLLCYLVAMLMMKMGEIGLFILGMVEGMKIRDDKSLIKV